jgi:hypothetical protein
MVKLLHEIWSKSPPPNKLCQVFWMVFWWYSAQKIFRFSPPRAGDVCARIHADRGDSCWTRAGLCREGEKIRKGAELVAGWSLSTAHVAVQRGRTAGVVMETPVTLVMPRRDSLVRGSNRGTPRITISGSRHQWMPRLSHQWPSSSPTASAPFQIQEPPPSGPINWSCRELR